MQNRIDYVIKCTPLLKLAGVIRFIFVTEMLGEGSIMFD